jgi:membrane associated rhomboid family serine protease
MSNPQPMTMALPKPGRALWVLMTVMAVLGIGSALLLQFVPSADAGVSLLKCTRALAFRQPWRLVTSGLLTDSREWSHLVYSLLGLYFLGAPLERRWGSWRFVRFVATAIVLGNLTVLAVPASIPAELFRFRPDSTFGPMAAITALAIAWSREFADATINIFFVVPVRGRWFFWITVGFCVLGLIYPQGVVEGVLAPFGGIIAGVLFGGTPSLLRTGWLRLRLAFLRRSASNLQARDVLTPRAERRQRSGGPPLRVVPGGLEEVLKKRNPPKDKRYLN